jgi:hypothetical protein
MPEYTGVEKESDYYMRLTREHAEAIKALKADRRRLGVIVRDLTFITKELVSHEEAIADTSIGSALDTHQQDLDVMLVDEESDGS